MNQQLIQAITQAINADSIQFEESIQELWSGYGRIARYRCRGSEITSLILKEIELGKQARHPRGWDTDYSHARKLKSYRVESYWYDKYAKACHSKCRVADTYFIQAEDDQMTIALEDLDASGFPLRITDPSINDIKVILEWLASFHANFILSDAEGLWDIGTYWHLDTRPDEWNRMEEGQLKEKARAIDTALNTAIYQTVIHGDAKLANFCFSRDRSSVAAVDFQYVGKGCGIKDVAYLISSCLDADDCFQYEEKLLDHYFTHLKTAFQKGKEIDAEEVEKEWRGLYSYAWADFARFLEGWSPDHWKLHPYNENQVEKVLDQLEK